MIHVQTAERQNRYG